MDELLDSAPCGYISFKDDGTIVALNQTLATLVQGSKDELIGKSVESILTIASRIFYNTHFFPLLKLHDKADEIFISLRGSQQKNIPVLLNATRRQIENQYLNDCIMMPINQRQKYEDEILAAKRNAEKAIKENQHLVTLTSILESKTAELDQQYAKLLSMNKDLLQFSKVISHDLQETLHKMSVFTDKLSIDEASSLSEKGKKSIKKLNSAITKATGLINGLHSFIGITEDDQFENVDLNEIITYAAHKAQELLSFNDIDLIFGDLPVIAGDESQLAEAFYQLIANSIHYRDPNRKLIITIEHTLLKENRYKHISDKYDYTDHVKIVFKDNGRGFDSSLNDYVFALFKKVHSDSSGLGIGLPLAKKIIENHYGLITVTSEPGNGTAFTITLPIGAP
jgi:sigma-B regulation protein RsbU (phosphoserine phosphatase)